MPTPRWPSPNTSATSPEETNEVLPHSRSDRLKQLKTSLSLRLSSLDPGWLQRCHNEASEEALSTYSPGLDAEESQSLVSGRVMVLDPDNHSEASAQGPEAAVSQAAQVNSWNPQPSQSHNRKKRRNENWKGSAQVQQDSSQAGPPFEGAGASTLEKHPPGEPVQVNLSQPCNSSSQTRIDKAEGSTYLHISRPATLDKGNYIRLNMKHKHYARAGALRGRFLRRQVGYVEWSRQAFPCSHLSPE